MNIDFNCERCDQTYSADHTYFNKEFTCGKCGHSFLILPIKDENNLNMETLLKRIIQALGIITTGYVIAKIIKAIGVVTVALLAFLIAIWMITYTIITIRHEEIQKETYKIKTEYMNKESEREKELKIHGIEFDEKLILKLGIDKEIQQATTKLELLQIRIKAEKEGFESEIKYLEQKLQNLREVERKHLADLPKQIINIQLVNGTLENVMWVRNESGCFIYKDAYSCGGGMLPFSKLAPSGIRLLGLIDEI